MPTYSVFMTVVVFGAIAALRLEGVDQFLRFTLLLFAALSAALLTRRKLREMRAAEPECDY